MASSDSRHVERLSQPPFKPGKPFIIEALGGENIYIPASSAIVRHLVTGKDTENAFALVGSGGIPNDFPVPFHYHRKMRHDFLCVKGQMKVWLNDQCRILNPGDYASVAPNTIHSYQFTGDYTELFGIIVPGGWEEFFRFIGAPYSGPLWPDVDESDPRKTQVPKMAVAADDYDVNPVLDHPRVEVQPWSEKDTVLSGTNGPFFMRNGKAPSAVLGGTVIRTIITGAETDGLFTLGSWEGSSMHKTQVLARGITFPTIHHCIFVQDGWLKVTVNETETSRLGPFETFWLPAGTKFQLQVDSRYAKAYFYGNPGGLIDLLFETGKHNPHTAPNCFIPEVSEPFNEQRLLDLCSKFTFQLE